MQSQVYPTPLGLLRPFLICSLMLCTLALGACGGDDDSGTSVSTGGEDSGTDGGRRKHDEVDEFDAAGFEQPMMIDAGTPIAGDPPPELEGQACAVDTNKVYELITVSRQAEPTRLAVDTDHSRFALAYLDKSEQCIDATYVAELEGPSGVGEPVKSLAFDPCTIIDHAAIEYNGEHWLLGSVDARKDTRDLWVQEFDSSSKTKYTAFRVTDSAAIEVEFALQSLGNDGVLAAWVEQDAVGGPTRLMTRLLYPQGDAIADAVELEQPKDVNWTISNLSMAVFGDNYIGLVYRRADDAGHAEIVLDMLDRSGVRDRDSWVLSSEAGGFGSADISADSDGAGVIYSIVEGDSQQLWFQLLGLDGRAAPVTSGGGRVGGPSEPVRIIGPPFKATDASLAKLPVGYAVAYRALPGGQVDSPRVRVHFLDRFGRVLGFSDVALAKPIGGRTAIKAARDGRITVGWSDTGDDGLTTLTAIKLPCVGGI
jgi:hypothetical protein